MSPGDSAVVIDLADPDTQAENEAYKYIVKRFILHPGQWKQYPNRFPLTWTRVKFTKKNAAKIPSDKSGVYSFVVKPGIANHPAFSVLLYVGKVEERGFKKRYLEYLSEPQKKKARVHIKRLLTKWKGKLYFYYAPIDDPSMVTTIEDDLIKAYIPAYNREFPATIRNWVKAIFT